MAVGAPSFEAGHTGGSQRRTATSEGYSIIELVRRASCFELGTLTFSDSGDLQVVYTFLVDWVSCLQLKRGGNLQAVYPDLTIFASIPAEQELYLSHSHLPSWLGALPLPRRPP